MIAPSSARYTEEKKMNLGPKKAKPAKKDVDLLAVGLQLAMRQGKRQEALHAAARLIRGGYGQFVIGKLAMSIVLTDVGLTWPDGVAVVQKGFKTWQSILNHAASTKKPVMADAYKNVQANTVILKTIDRVMEAVRSALGRSSARELCWISGWAASFPPPPPPAAAVDEESKEEEHKKWTERLATALTQHMTAAAAQVETKMLDEEEKQPTAYIAFVHEIRPKLQAKFPNSEFGELGKRVGAAWKALSEDEKKVYEAKQASSASENTERSEGLARFCNATYELMRALEHPRSKWDKYLWAAVTAFTSDPVKKKQIEVLQRVARECLNNTTNMDDVGRMIFIQAAFLAVAHAPSAQSIAPSAQSTATEPMESTDEDIMQDDVAEDGAVGALAKTIASGSVAELGESKIEWSAKQCLQTDTSLRILIPGDHKDTSPFHTKWKQRWSLLHEQHRSLYNGQFRRMPYSILPFAKQWNVEKKVRKRLELAAAAKLKKAQKRRATKLKKRVAANVAAGAAVHLEKGKSGEPPLKRVKLVHTKTTERKEETKELSSASSNMDVDNTQQQQSEIATQDYFATQMMETSMSENKPPALEPATQPVNVEDAPASEKVSESMVEKTLRRLGVKCLNPLENAKDRDACAKLIALNRQSVDFWAKLDNSQQVWNILHVLLARYLVDYPIGETQLDCILVSPAADNVKVYTIKYTTKRSPGRIEELATARPEQTSWFQHLFSDPNKIAESTRKAIVACFLRHRPFIVNALDQFWTKVLSDDQRRLQRAKSVRFCLDTLLLA
jgi:hypothetical protein